MRSSECRLSGEREGQRHCSTSCRDIYKKRLKRNGDKHQSPISVARSGDTARKDSPRGLGDGPTTVWPERVFESLHQALSKAMTTRSNTTMTVTPAAGVFGTEGKPEPLAEAACR
jgi:hypothetical protein